MSENYIATSRPANLSRARTVRFSKIIPKYSDNDGEIVRK